MTLLIKGAGIGSRLSGGIKNRLSKWCLFEQFYGSLTEIQ